jgi:hypothetical protein
MQLRMNIIREDGSSVEAVASTLDLVRWEERSNRSIASLFEDRKLGDITWLAWQALARKGQTDLGYDEWLDTVQTIELGGDDEPAPLESSASTGR